MTEPYVCSQAPHPVEFYGPGQGCAECGWMRDDWFWSLKGEIDRQMIEAIDAVLDADPCPLCGIVHRRVDGCPPHETVEIKGIFAPE